jgi:hypothetical protein
MPTVVMEGPFRFVVNTRENLFEPPHVHAWVASEDVCPDRAELRDVMDEPPPGQLRDILGAYRRHAELIRQVWDQIHQR